MTQAQLYSILMESDTAYKNAEWICAALGVPCPPDRNRSYSMARTGLPRGCRSGGTCCRVTGKIGAGGSIAERRSAEGRRIEARRRAEER